MHVCIRDCVIVSRYFQKAQEGGSRESDVRLHQPQQDGGRHQEWALPRARRVRRQPVWHQDGLHTRGGGGRTRLHSGRQPSGSISTTANNLPPCFSMNVQKQNQTKNVITADTTPPLQLRQELQTPLVITQQ